MQQLDLLTAINIASSAIRIARETAMRWVNPGRPCVSIPGGRRQTILWNSTRAPASSAARMTSAPLSIHAPSA